MWQKFCRPRCEAQALRAFGLQAIHEMVEDQGCECPLCGELLYWVSDEEMLGDRAPSDRVVRDYEDAHPGESCVIGEGGRWDCDVDHILPVASGGNDDWTNLRAVHPKCNRSRRRIPGQYGPVRCQMCGRSGGQMVSGQGLAAVHPDCIVKSCM